MTAEKTAKFRERYGKPFFVSKYGTDWRGWKPDTDPHFRALHKTTLGGALTGTARTVEGELRLEPCPFRTDIAARLSSRSMR